MPQDDQDDGLCNGNCYDCLGKRPPVNDLVKHRTVVEVGVHDGPLCDEFWRSVIGKYARILFGDFLTFARERRCNMLLAFIGGYSIGEIAIFIVIVAAVIALMFIGLRRLGWTIPGWVVECFWVVVVAMVVVFCIRLVMSM